jgi:hypothetical protein
MSPSKKEGLGYSPATEPRLTPGEYQDMAMFFKQFLEGSPLRKWIILAGVGAGIEVLHIIWLAIRYLLKF